MVDAALIGPGSGLGRRPGATSGETSQVAVEVYHDPADAAAAWDELERVAPVSPYQTRAWVQAWVETRGPGLGVRPLIIVARDPSGEAVALLPFGSWRRGPMHVAGFLGGRDSNSNLGLFRTAADWDRRSIMSLVRRGVAQAGVDVLVLKNQPAEWEGTPNPLASLPSQASPSFTHKVDLLASPDAFFRDLLSKDTRKKLRRKRERLALFGPVSHRQALTDPDRQAVLDAFVSQRAARNRAIGLDSTDLAHLRRFYDRASRDDHAARVELHGLWSGERLVATFVGATHRTRFSGMSLSFDTDPALARCSPGELMVGALLAAKCSAGLTVLDLGIGEARYKDTYCPTPEPLIDAIVPLTARGQVFAQAERLRLSAKRSIKQSSLTWAAVRTVRRAWAALRRGRTGPRRG